MYSVGETVCYAATGVCRIDGEIMQKVKGEMKKYIVLKPVYNENATVYVPVDNQRLMEKIKPVLTCEQAQEIIGFMVDLDAGWISADSERTQAFREILSGGDIKKVAAMVRSLYIHRQKQFEKGRKLHASDEHFFKDAQQLLFDELGHALGIKPEDVSVYIHQKMEEC